MVNGLLRPFPDTVWPGMPRRGREAGRNGDTIRREGHWTINVDTCHGQSSSRSASMCPPLAAALHVNSLHAQSAYSRAHRNTARCSPAAASKQVHRFHGQSCSRPLQHLQVPARSGACTSHLVPLAVALPESNPERAPRPPERGAGGGVQPLEHLRLDDVGVPLEQQEEESSSSPAPAPSESVASEVWGRRQARARGSRTT